MGDLPSATHKTPLPVASVGNHTRGWKSETASTILRVLLPTSSIGILIVEQSGPRSLHASL